MSTRHGRRAGDETLKAVAELARSHARETDVVERVGGEEFAWLMPECDGSGAEQAAERLRSFVAATPMAHVGLVTASIGVAELEAEESPGDLYESADAALYRAKEAGRNRVRVSPAAAPSIG